MMRKTTKPANGTFVCGTLRLEVHDNSITFGELMESFSVIVLTATKPANDNYC